MNTRLTATGGTESHNDESARPAITPTIRFFDVGRRVRLGHGFVVCGQCERKMLVAIAVSSIKTSPSPRGMHMPSDRRAVIADAKTNVPTVPHHHLSTQSQYPAAAADDDDDDGANVLVNPTNL